MRFLAFTVTFFILAAMAAGHQPSYANAANQKAGSVGELPLYIDNVHIVDVTTGQLMQSRQLQMRNGKIAGIQPADTPIADEHYVLRDGLEHFVTPGLVDMHVHAYDPAAFTIALSHGVTHMRLMNGVKEHIGWRKELEEGSRVGSTITVSSPIISGYKTGTCITQRRPPQTRQQRWLGLNNKAMT